jgi:protein-S-isoprenylcysteine O-methyltransferase Ste14
MAVPLVGYLALFLNSDMRTILLQSGLKTEVWVLLFDNEIIVGRIVALIGLIVFLVAAVQWLWFRHKRLGLFKNGLYSRLRHPQFTGIINRYFRLDTYGCNNAYRF